MCFFFFKQKTAYEMRISDWSSDVCSSDLLEAFLLRRIEEAAGVDEHDVGAGIVGRKAIAVGAQFGQDAFAVDQRLAAAERGGVGEQFEFPGHLQCRLAAAAHLQAPHRAEIGRESCRERWCQYV